jgi:aspartate/methionine/tyrosine aminotransferase
MYDRAMVNGGLSKAYALPGLRLGWLAGPDATIADSWAYHDYTSITAGILSNRIAEVALSPEMRPKILERNRTMLRHNLEIMVDWLATYGELFHFVPPKAGGMAFMRYDLDINSTELANWLRTTKSVFILAGDCYGMDHYFRVGIGTEKAALVTGLSRIRDALKERFNV